MERFERFADDMCNCHDTACAQSVADDMTRWSQEQASQDKESFELSADEKQRMGDIGMRLSRCMQQAMTPPAGGSGTP